MYLFRLSLLKMSSLITLKLYMSGDGYLSVFSVKIVCCIFHKYEDFHKYRTGDVHLIGLCIKILNCILQKHEIFNLYITSDGYPIELFVNILC